MLGNRNGSKLKENEWRQKAEVYRVNPAIHDEVSKYAQHNQCIHTGIEADVRQVDQNRKPSPRRCCEGAGRNQNKAAMIFGTLSPENC